MAAATKKVFISYSWAVQDRVIELAERLIANGVDVVLDVYDLKEGQDKYAFMEQSVHDPSIDRVLIICDRTYTEKADDRTGGVGDETVIISPDVYGQMRQEKFIPIVFEVDENGQAYRPVYLKTRIYIDLSTADDRYEAEYEKLLRNIYEKPIHKKPALGTKPEWLENETVDLSAIRDLNKQIRGYTGGNPAKADFLLRKAADEFVRSAKQYFPPNDKPFDEALLIAIDQVKNYRDLFLDFCENLIYCGMPLGETVGSLLERLYNELLDASGKNSYRESDFELYSFMIWELMIAATALMLHYDRYEDLHTLLARPYFLRRSKLDTAVEAHNYFHFRAYCRTIETTCKQKCENPNYFTLTGNILVQRERKPILTKESISTADIILYQLGSIIAPPDDERDYWFPTSYIYHSGNQVIWQKLKSASFCKKVAPLFGAKTVVELKDKIKDSRVDRSMSYHGAWNAAPCILSSIKIDDVGTLM